MGESHVKYSVLIMGRSELIVTAIRSAGLNRYFSGVTGVPASISAERALVLHPANILVLTDPNDLSAVRAAYRSGFLAVLLICPDAADRNAYIDSGVFCCTRAELPATLPQLLAACTRLRETRGEAEALRGKLDEARLISRAKLLLISRFKMSEDEAHRFLERSAMDNCTKLRNAAESVIRTYEE